MKTKTLAVYILILIFLFVSVTTTNNKVFAKYNNNQYLINDAVSRFPKEARDFKLFLADYKPFCDYLNYGNNKDILFNFKELRFDEEGMPKVRYGGAYYYNPVTLAQYSLSVYGEYLKGENTKENFLKIVDKLLTLQDNRGGFLYDFSWRYYLNNYDYKPGWVLGMAQGEALSVLARAYKITGNKKYLVAGNKALNFLITPISKGGVMSNLGRLSPALKNNIIFEEYISDVPTYTLNGFMFTLLGLYDWANIDASTKNIAENYFNEGIKSLAKILNYYDIGGFTCYDLGYITKNTQKPHIAINYHGVHIYLLNALYSITNNRVLYDYYKLWKAYVNTNEVNRISGVNRYETNVNISREFTRGALDTIILASGENYADALSAVPLASKNQCPILLTENKNISSFTINELKRLNPNKVIVIGGEGAISQKVCNDIKKTNPNIVFERIGGEDRYETSYLISSKINNSTEAFLVYGNNYADTLSIATISAIKGIPILLTEEKYIPKPIKNYIDTNTNKYYIIGGKGVISENVESQIQNSERIGGKDRYETNIEVLNKFIGDLDLSKVYVAIGGPSNLDYADALSCAPLAAISRSSIILLPTTRQIPKSVTEFAYDKLQKDTNIIAVGGKAVLPNYKINFIIPEK